MSIQPNLPEYQQRVIALLSRFVGLSIRATFPLPDIVGFGFAREVVENGLATIALLESRTPRPANAVARAAFEAAVEFGVYATEPDLEFAAARVRVSELIGHQELVAKEREARTLFDPSLTLPPARPAADIIEEEAKFFEQGQPGSAALIRRAAAAVLTDRAQRRFLWNGSKSRGSFHEILSSRAGEPDLRKHLDLWYAISSRESHPASRSGTRSLRITSAAITAHLSPTDEDRDEIAVIPLATLRVAIEISNRACDVFFDKRGY